MSIDNQLDCIGYCEMCVECTAESAFRAAKVMTRQELSQLQACPDCGGCRVIIEGGCACCLCCGWSLCSK